MFEDLGVLLKLSHYQTKLIETCLNNKILPLSLILTLNISFIFKLNPQFLIKALDSLDEKSSSSFSNVIRNIE